MADQSVGRCALVATTFHALGGQDVRDGFDYVFARRKRDSQDFIAVVHTTGVAGEQVHAGRYGDASYFGLSPRPHDLYLEEMWEMPSKDELKAMAPRQGAWFAAESIRDIYFRVLPTEDKKVGVTTRVGVAGIEEAIRQERYRVANEIATAITTVVDNPDDHAEADAAFTRTLHAVERGYRDAPRGQDVDGDEQYRYWIGVTQRLIEFGAAATALAAEGDFHRTARHIASAAVMGQLRLRVPPSPWERWIKTVGEEAHNLRNEGGMVNNWAYQALIGLVVEEISAIHNAEWDFPAE
ncbi:MAG TPA: DUF6338 family protein [Solirubrobacteraceae bacterium]